MSVLAVRDVWKDFGEAPVLQAITFSVDQGDSIALIGHNGAGKSTLLSLCCNLLEPSAGEILVDGEPADSVSARRAVAYVPDRPVLYDDISVGEHVEFVASLHDHPQYGATCDPLIRELGLRPYLESLPQELSLGTRQKVSILLAFARPFDVLLADEPLTALDIRSREVVMHALAEVVRAGRALVVATHDLHFAIGMRRALALREGAVTYDGPVADASLSELVGDA